MKSLGRGGRKSDPFDKLLQKNRKIPRSIPPPSESDGPHDSWNGGVLWFGRAPRLEYPLKGGEGRVGRTHTV